MATTIFNAGSGNWHATTTWKLAVVPTAADNVVLNFFNAAHPRANYQVNLDGTGAAQDLTVLDHNILHLSANSSPFGATLNVNQVLVGTGGIISGIGDLFAQSVQNGGTIDATKVIPLHITTSAPLVNSGKLLAVHGNLEVTGDLENAGTAHSAAHRMKLGNVINSGELEATGFAGNVEVQGTLNNSGQVDANGAGKGDVRISVRGVATNSGTVFVHGDFFESKVEFFANVTNTGQMKAGPDGELIFDAGVTNRTGGQLIARKGGIVRVDGAATGGFGLIEGNGSVLAFNGSASQDTTTTSVFEGSGKLVLDHSANYAGTIVGFGISDRIDVKDVAFVSGKSSFDHNTDILTVADGTHTSKIQFVGSYPSNDFVFKSDGHGGTMVSLGARNNIAFSHIALGAQTTLGYLQNRTETGATLLSTDGAHAAAIMLLGNYMAGSLVTAANGHGDTLITAAQTANQTVLSAPHTG